jgi:Tol biopolymer transport system component
MAVACILWAGSASVGARAQTPDPQPPPDDTPWKRRLTPWSDTSQGISGNSYSTTPLLSDDGRFLIYQSSAYNLTINDTNDASDVFLRDMVAKTTKRLSVSLNGQQANGPSYTGGISADGRYVVYESRASNLTPGEANSNFDIFLHDNLTGATERISVADNGEQGNQDSLYGRVSDDGRFVAFNSYAYNLTPQDSNMRWDIFVRDRLRGVTKRISEGINGKQANSSSWDPSMTPDGRYVVFDSAATNLIPDDTNDWIDIFLVDQVAGTIERVSLTNTGEQADGNSIGATVSDDGRLVAFLSSATNLIPGDTNAADDIFVRDRQTGVTTLVTTANDGGPADNTSGWPNLSGDGQYVIFPSLAENLTRDKINRKADVFLHDLHSGVTRLISKASDGAPANDHSWLASMTPNGRYVVFDSAASNMTRFDMNGTADIFLRDMLSGTTECISCTFTAIFFPVIYRAR